MIALFVLFFSAFGIGRIVLWKMHCVFQNTLENTVSAIGIGLGTWCYLLFFLGHIGLLYPWLLMLLALTSAVPAIAWTAKNIRQSHFHFPKIAFSFFDAAALTLTFGLLILIYICCFSPVVGGISNDEIATHLSVPKSWLALHKIAVLPDPSSAIAGHIELLFLWTMAFASESGPKLFSWTCLLLSMAILYNFTKDKIGARAALYACIFTAINPLIFRESCTAFTDIPAAMFLLLALWALWRFSGTGKKALLVLSAFFIGIGCGAKPTVYFYIPAFFVLCAIVLFATRERGITFIKSLAGIGILVALFAAPWPMRNVILSGSPTFPPPMFLYALHGNKPFVFSGQPYAKKDAQVMYDYYRSRIQKHGTGLKNFLLLPWNITMHPESLSIGDSVGTIMLSLLPIVFFFRRRPPWLNSILIFCLIAGSCIYFLIIPEARYFITVFFVLAPVFAWTMENVRQHVPRILPLVEILVLSNCAFSCAIGVRKFYPECKSAIIPEYRRFYCQKNTPFYEAFEFCNREKPGDLVVLYNNQVFYYLKTAYHVDDKILDNIKSHPDACVLDIDYSQTLGRDLKTQSNAYCIRAVPSFLKLVFNGPDARIYRVRQ
jgi:4-amino-4-deoxy-L-arabinose transferase and related glycosyltransferases of PMT family